ncbi:MAG: PQQ-binding-like beta-propeller repeat protein [Candidatus Latescibacteria bacterium]|nr:PQQ-binding-like beta-propeller repeat protein [Candidatus Latescibacterota bacterium]
MKREYWLAVLVGTLLAAGLLRADDWPGWRGPQGDGVWREEGLIEDFEEEQIPLRWQVPVGSGYSGPTVAQGRVFITDRITKPTQQERVHCFDWESGETLWSYEYECAYRDVGYPAGPRAAVTVHDGRAYALGTMGHLHCFEAASGKILWKKDLAAEYNTAMPVWGLAAAPLIAEDLVIVQAGGSPGACLVAFDRVTGKERWRALDDRASYSTPTLIEQAGKEVLAAWTGDNVVGLDPASGQTYWQHAFPPVRGIIGIAGPVFAAGRLLVTSFFDGALMLEVDPKQMAVQQLWHRRGPSEQKTDGLHSIISTPLLLGDYIYGVDSYGELRCLEAATGARVWENTTVVPRARWATVHMVPQGDRVWMFNERGELLITKLSPEGVEIISRAKLIEPTRDQLNKRGGVCWSHPAFAYKHVFARNDEMLVCASLAQKP